MSGSHPARPLRVVAFGDSVTAGFTRAGTVEPDIVFHRQVKLALERLHAGLTVEMVNAGLAMDTATDALTRLAKDVIAHRPELVLVEFGLNDAIGLGSAAGGEPGLEAFERDLTTIVESVHEQTEAAVLLLTPNFTVMHDNPRIDADERAFLPRLLPLQSGGVMAAYARAVRSVAANCGVAVADVYAAWEALAASGRDTDELLANGLNHPTAEGHALAARLILEAINRAA